MKYKLRKFIALSIASTMSIGCISIADIKSSEPIAAPAMIGDPDQAKECLLDQVEKNTSFIPYVRGNTVTLFSAGGLGASADPVWVISIASENNKTKATIRGRSDFIFPGATRLAFLDDISACFDN